MEGFYGGFERRVKVSGKSQQRWDLFDLMVAGCCGPHLESLRVIFRIGTRSLLAGRKSTYYERLEQDMIADEPYEYNDYDILHNNARFNHSNEGIHSV